MKYLIICPLLLLGAFFCSPANANDQYTCPDGGTYQNHPELGHICSEPAPSGTVRPCFHDGVLLGQVRGTEFEALRNCEGLTDDDFGPAPYPAVCNVTDLPTLFYTSSGAKQRRSYSSVNGICNTSNFVTQTINFNIGGPQTNMYCPPDSSPELRNFHDGTPDKLCWAAADEPEPEPPCDCNDFRGEAPYSFENLIAPVGTYNTTDNMPQCMTLSRSTNPGDTDAPVAQCECQVSAKKWLKFSGPTIDGVEHDRWEAYPVAQGQPSGTITGVTCAKDDGVTEPTDPDAPKDCFTLNSGAKWCWADPGEKCTIVNGQEQCSSGCGYINGDFVCYEEEEPTTPTPPDEELTDPDDNITDPNKTTGDMTKGDFKEINRGTEQRLDNVVTALQNNNNQLKGIGEGISDVNDNLDGIGRQLDGQGKTLTGIKDGLDDAFGDDGEPDGAGEGITGSWYDSAYPDGLIGIWNEHSTSLQQTPMFEFLNQFQLSPSGAQPDMNICFNLGAVGDFGCKAVEIPEIIWPFLKICILITAAWLCRALIFGG